MNRITKEDLHRNSQIEPQSADEEVRGLEISKVQLENARLDDGHRYIQLGIQLRVPHTSYHQVLQGPRHVSGRGWVRQRFTNETGGAFIAGYELWMIEIMFLFSYKQFVNEGRALSITSTTSCL